MISPQSPGANEVAVVAEGKGEVVVEMAEDDKKVDDVVSDKNGLVGDPELEDLAIEVAPQSPTLSMLCGDVGDPPSSDSNIEMKDVEDLVVSEGEGVHLAASDAAGTERSGLAKRSKRRRSGDSGGEGKPVQKRLTCKGAGESDDDSEGSVGRGLSRSVDSSRKLKRLMKSGMLVVDERKREGFEEKCRGLDRHAVFKYKGSWQVRQHTSLALLLKVLALSPSRRLLNSSTATPSTPS
jgi:hypothetical protein